MKNYKLPKTIKAFQDAYKLNYNTLLSENPKTIKSDIKTYILHLAPSNQSGIINVCPSALNCAKLCLHHSGNKLYYPTKVKSRINKTIAFNDSQNDFMNILILNIIRNFRKNNNELTAYRLNGTSDILFENIQIYISVGLSDFIYNKFSFNINSGYYSNIFEIFKHEKNIIMYDYTKNKREYQNLLNEFNYHLTFSFDGESNKINIDRCFDAMENNINIASVINYKKKEILPTKFYSKIFDINFDCIDGDNDDMRFLDAKNKLVLLRFKKPIGIKYNKKDIEKFTIR
jgi:hypothetical protein|tara:strand:- start:184 stop:1044 length:861 start_codon:yes stop_codon:yes gene_type:complete